MPPEDINNIDQMEADKQLIGDRYGPNMDSLEARTKAAFKGTTGELDVTDFSTNIQTYSQLEASDEPIETDSQDSAILKWGQAASKEAFKAYEGGMVWATRKYMESQATEPYNAFKDEALAAEGDEFIAKYADDFFVSPSSEYTQGMINLIKQRENEQQAVKDGGSSAFWGQMTGLVLDPFNFVPIMGVRNVGANVLKGIASGAVQTGAAVGASEVLRQEADPTITDEESLDAVLLSTVLGGALFGATAGLVGREAVEATNITKNIIRNDASPTALEETTQLLDDVAASTQRKTLAEQDLETIGKEDLGVAKTNWVYNFTQKASAYLIPEQRMLNSESGIVRAIVNRMAPHNTLLRGNLKGIATPETVVNRVEASYANKTVTMDNSIRDAYLIHKKAGGQLDLPEFVREGRANIISGTKSTLPGVDTLMDSIRSYWREFVPTVKASRKMPDDWKPRDDYFHYEWSYGKLIENQATAIDDITEELAKLRANDGDALSVDRKQLRTEASEILDNMIRSSQGRSTTDAFTAKGLRERTLKFSPDFANKYLSDDAYGSIMRYTKDVLTEAELRKLFGQEGNIYDNAKAMIRNDYNTLRESAIEAGDNKRLKELIDAENRDAEDIKGMIDMFTGRLANEESRTLRTAASIAKGYSYLRRMGKVAISQIPDFARLLGLKVFKGRFGTEMKDLVGETIDSFKLAKDTDSARRIGIIADELMSTGGQLSRASAVGDLTESAYMTKGQRIMRNATSAFSKVTLMDAMNNFSRTVASEDAAKNMLIGAGKLVKGTLKEGSLEAIDMAKFGIDKKFAKQIIKEFDKHKIVEKKWGGNVVFSNYESWSPEVQLKFASLIRRAVDNTIVQKTIGSHAPFISQSVGSLIFQFKGFQIASHSKVLLPTLQRMSGLGAASSIQMMQIVAADLALATLAGYMHDFVSGREIDLSPEKMALNAFDRASIMSSFSYPSAVLDKFGAGVGSLLGEDGSSKFRQVNVLEALLGPTAGTVQDLTNTALRFTDGKITDGDMEQAARLLPGQNLLWWAWAVNKISE